LLECKENAVSSQNVALEEMHAKLRVIAASVPDTISTAEATEKVKNVMKTVISPQVVIAAESKELLEVLRERVNSLKQREKMLQLKRSELLEMRATVGDKQRILEEKQKKVSALEEEVTSINTEIPSLMEKKSRLKDAVIELEKRRDKLEAIKQAKIAEYEERNRKKEALQVEISQLRVCLQERNEECEAKKNELSRL
uniref:Uncharacterized protein n=1 Tax=Parascaris univalens TaxID=6257 RepID=A0A915A3D2_PARUN